mmetsp:Transcript_18898/g.32518  ORF Transcript_18898/g.32518 Transcript_18898/m.32518 type:complete len:85 (-) Transcript_18898:132-386(-)
MKHTIWLFRGKTSTVSGKAIDSEASDSDFINMRKVLDDKHGPSLFRVEAGFTLGLLHYLRSERYECEDAYHDAIRIEEKSKESQ